MWNWHLEPGVHEDSGGNQAADSAAFKKELRLCYGCNNENILSRLGRVVAVWTLSSLDHIWSILLECWFTLMRKASIMAVLKHLRTSWKRTFSQEKERLWGYSCCL